MIFQSGDEGAEGGDRPVRQANSGRNPSATDEPSTGLAEGPRSDRRAIVETVPHGILEIDRSGLITFSNTAGDRIFGSPRGGLIGRSVVDLQASAGARAIMRDFLEELLVEHPAPAPFTSECVTCDHVPVWVRVDWSFRRDESGSIAGFIFVLTDITEHRSLQSELRQARDELEIHDRQSTASPGQSDDLLAHEIKKRTTAEAAAREGEESYKLLVENQTDMIVSFDRDGRLDFVSPSYCKVFGKTRQELIGKAFIPLIHDDDRQAVEEAIARVRAAPHRSYVEERALTVHGWRWQAWLNTATLDADGAVASIVAVGRDITDRKEAEEALTESEQRLGMALDATNLGMWDFDPTTYEIAHFNDRWFTMLGYEPGELPHSAEMWISLIHPDDVEKTQDALKDHLDGRCDYSAEFRMKTKEGAYRWIHSTGKVIEWDEDGTPSRMIGVHRDITERRAADEERRMLESTLRHTQKTEVIGTLASGIAHDFNNILASMIGYTELALDVADRPSPIDHYLDQVLVAGNRARDLVAQILTFSRQAGQVTARVELNPLVREVARLLRSTIPSSIEIDERTGDEIVSTFADPTQIHQMIVNLATNAAHAMEKEGGVMVVGTDRVTMTGTVRGELPDLAPGEYARLTVSDSGTGIAREIMGRLFEPYFTTKEPGKGTGLGLAVVRGIVKSHKGQITVCSRQGKGTTVQVFLPVAAAIESSAPPRSAADLPRGSEKILFVDDEPAIVSLQKDVLCRLGYTVTSLDSSLEALGAFRAAPDAFDLVITDMTMPGLTGDRLAAEIRRIRPDMPIIVCTGFSDKMGGDDSAGRLHDRCLMKPIGSSTMATVIRQILDRSED